MEHLDEQDLAQLALDETDPRASVPEAWAHLAGCERCSGELAAYRRVLELGRELRPETGSTSGPGPQVWDRIARATGMDGASPATEAPTAPADPAAHPHGAPHPHGDRPRARPHRRAGRLARLAGAAVLVLAAAIGGGVVIGRATAPHPPAAAASASADLHPVPPASSTATGSATIVMGAQGADLTVVTDHLPLWDGFYQVWLYDQGADKMVPIGTLNAAGNGTFTITPSIDIHAFNIVDISAQQLNGNPAHGTSILRGTLTQ